MVTALVAKAVAAVALAMVFQVETGPAQPACRQVGDEVMHHQARPAVKEST